jgi:hypothetical protein
LIGVAVALLPPELPLLSAYAVLSTATAVTSPAANAVIDLRIVNPLNWSKMNLASL